MGGYIFKWCGVVGGGQNVMLVDLLLAKYAPSLSFGYHSEGAIGAICFRWLRDELDRRASVRDRASDLSVSGL